MFQRFALILVVSLIVAATVHRPLFSHSFSCADMSQVAGIEEMDDLLTSLIIAAEAKCLGSNPTLWAAVGWLLLGFVATAWGFVAGALTKSVFGDSKLTSAGLWTAAILAALPISYDLIVSPVGHSVLLSALVLAACFGAAIKWPSAVTWIVLPVVLGIVYRSPLSGACFWTGPCVAWTTQSKRTARMAVIAASIGTLWWLWSAAGSQAPIPLNNAPDPGASSGLEALTQAARALFLPAPAIHANAWSQAVSISFAASLLILGLSGHFAARGLGRRTALMGGGLTVLALLHATFGDALPDSLLGGRALMTGGLGIALGAGISATVLSRTSLGWIAPCSFLVMIAGSSSLSVRQQVLLRPSADNSRELTALIEQIRPLRGSTVLDEVLLVGIGSTDNRYLSDALIASQRPPFADSTSPRFRALPSGYTRVPLLAEEGRTLVLDWRPSNLASVSTRPNGWILAPLLVANSPDSNSPIALLKPAQDAERVLGRPQTLESDMTFSFKVKSACLRTHDVVFYGAYEGGFNPNGKQQLTARRLSPSVLTAIEKAGWTTIHWRTSIRPGPGQDGVRFEDRDLGLAGQTLHWTVGLVPKPETCEVDGHHHDNHESHEFTAPTDIAAPRRLHCKSPSVP